MFDAIGECRVEGLSGNDVQRQVAAVGALHYEDTCSVMQCVLQPTRAAQSGGHRTGGKQGSIAQNCARQGATSRLQP